MGAGFSGLYLALRLQQRCENVELVIYEKNEDVGGTWLENTYPGVACDIPAHVYCYSFLPNTEWSQVSKLQSRPFTISLRHSLLTYPLILFIALRTRK